MDRFPLLFRDVGERGPHHLLQSDAGPAIANGNRAGGAAVGYIFWLAS
jgi:hypothetical protein